MEVSRRCLCWVFCVASLCGVCRGQDRYENVALLKNCIMSSTYTPSDTNISHGIQLAVNGNNSNVWSGSNCVHSGAGDRSPFWEVDLGRPYPIQWMTSFARSDQINRMRNVTVSVDGQLCYRFPLSGNQPNQPITNVCKRVGTRVRLSRQWPQDDNYFLNFCELQVFSCRYPYWGTSCENTCGQCGEGQECDRVTGECRSCQPGWKDTAPRLCDQVCDDGYYGVNCSSECSPHCSTLCNKTTGYCSCQPGYQPFTCRYMCNAGLYGQNCLSQCEQGCANVCHHVSGNCSCSAGWKPPLCQQECTNFTYGDGCVYQCGNCSDGSACDAHTGHCPQGCQEGLQPPLCHAALQQQQNGGGGGGGGGGANAGAIVGAVVGGVVVVPVVAVVLWIKRRRMEKRKEAEAAVNQSAHVTLKDSVSTLADGVYESVTEDPEPRKNAVASPEEGATTNETDPRISLYSKPKPKPKPLPAAKPMETQKAVEEAATPPVPTPSVYANVDTSQPPPLPTSSSPPTHATPSHSEPVEEELQNDVTPQYDVYYNDDTYMTSEGEGLQMDAVQQSLLNKLRKQKALSAEFEGLEKGLARAHSVGSAKENYYNNRFNSIVPYDDNRVCLSDVPHLKGNDYINASYIQGLESDKAYIATQGPRPNTLEAMWWMVWQEKVSHIVMLTSCKEGEKKKCEEYWPAHGKGRNYGPISVTCVEEKLRADYVIRTFDVKVDQHEGCRQVTQFHFVTWQDHDVPTVTSLVDFWCSVSRSCRAQQQPGPLVVHCSAGVGRTGAFLALDILMQQVQHGGKPDVQQAAQRLRHDRCCMIQTKNQYKLVHEALLEAYTCSDCRRTEASLTGVLPPQVDPGQTNVFIDTQFKKLEQMKVLETKPCHLSAEQEENINKNRDITVLPDEGHMVYLTRHVRGRNQYINAVYTPTFHRRRGCILTQLPLKDTIVDFWRLVAGHDVTKIVSLGCSEDQSDPEECFWPTQPESVTSGPFCVTMTSRNKLGKHLASFSLVLSFEEEQSAEIQLLHYSAWGNELPDDLSDFIQLLTLLTEHDAAPDVSVAPVIIQCRDGGRRSGMLRAMTDVISRMTSEGEIDVYTGVKHIRNIRPECVSTKAQYRFLYLLLQRYSQTNLVYQNS